MNQATLKKYISSSPSSPGVYTFSAKGGKALYVGKALNLKNRIKNYIGTEDIRLKKMISNAHGLDFIKTDSDIEALILESQLIKKFRPQ
ncbi:MAG: nucleotide excision repair endonuclease, partial [Patescibacteria group bacterium]